MKAFLLAAIAAASMGAKAYVPPPIGHVISSTIDIIRIDKDGFATVYLSNYVWAEYGSCRSPGLDHALAFDSKTLAGQSLLAVMLDAKAKNYSLSGEGTGLCMMINGNSVETVNYLLVT
jgi:hypothetical protein